MLSNYLENAETTKEKDELTLGMFSVMNGDSEFKQEVARYAPSAHGHVRRTETYVRDSHVSWRPQSAPNSSARPATVFFCSDPSATTRIDS